MTISAPMHARWVLAVLMGTAAFGVMACQPVTVVPAQLGDGVYCLTFDVRIGEAVPFRLGDNTTLDCQGHRIQDLTGTTGNALIASGDNIVLKNCVFEGFNVQVLFTGATNYRIEGNVLANAGVYAIMAEGSQGLVDRNTVVSSVPQGQTTVTAMDIQGLVDVVGNTVFQPKDPSVGAGDWRQGILSYGNEGGLIRDNRVTTIASAGERGTAMAAGGRSLAYDNVLVATPGSDRAGLTCYESGSRLRNLIVGMAYPYVECGIQAQTALRGGFHGR